ncbi:alpha/beta fold hydrolase [Rivibacter subsaxonicus]|uniref:Polyhydroxyalkanoate synthase n=2 Tax=Rivibacter subsaxonicus TaxID=457575 RepID=A0A4V2FSN4_9BURK|nr:alpha/beta fold hydrolase [Rivibacter subsaxonicus]RZT94925.1 polyhydroxyalkanoate synthase [Rivibacter subsaxonicus]
MVRKTETPARQAKPAARKRAAAAAPTPARRKKAAPRAAAAANDRIGEAAARNTLAVNPLIGIRASDFGEAAQALIGAAVTQPVQAARHLGAYARKLGAAALGNTAHELDPRDRRFADPAWQSSPLLKRLLQAHATTAQELTRYIDATSLNARDKARAHLVASIFVDTISPSNTLLNPSALKRAVDTGGASLLEGVKNLTHDLRHNKGLPSSVDKSAFEVGRNVATTPGSVVFRNEVLELIQYQPATAQVYARPLVICPPQVNKFYAMDLTPDKSLIRFALSQGLQVFAISWFNPTKDQRGWNMSTYVQALDEAVDAARQITRSPDVNLWGACSGGMTAAAYLGWLAATGQPKVASVISPVCVLDPSRTMDTTMGLLASEKGLKTLKAAIKRKGVVDGSELARVFAWLRPNDLIWNYWVNNYLLGNKPPAFDILFWNADTTRLPAAFHADLIGVFENNPFVNAGRMEVLGLPLDLSQVEVEAYIVAGTTDHITPWRACYETARLYGKKSEFVLANAGHLQSLLNPPGTAKSFFLSGVAGSHDPDAWAAKAERSEGSWWPHWMAWMQQRSGTLGSAPKKPGSRKHPAALPAPGEYVMAG